MQLSAEGWARACCVSWWLTFLLWCSFRAGQATQQAISERQDQLTPLVLKTIIFEQALEICSWRWQASTTSITSAVLGLRTFGSLLHGTPTPASIPDPKCRIVYTCGSRKLEGTILWTLSTSSIWDKKTVGRRGIENEEDVVVSLPFLRESEEDRVQVCKIQG